MLKNVFKKVQPIKTEWNDDRDIIFFYYSNNLDDYTGYGMFFANSKDLHIYLPRFLQYKIILSIFYDLIR